MKQLTKRDILKRKKSKEMLDKMLMFASEVGDNSVMFMRGETPETPHVMWCGNIAEYCTKDKSCAVHKYKLRPDIEKKSLFDVKGTKMYVLHPGNQGAGL